MLLVHKIYIYITTNTNTKQRYKQEKKNIIQWKLKESRKSSNM